MGETILAQTEGDGWGSEAEYLLSITRRGGGGRGEGRREGRGEREEKGKRRGGRKRKEGKKEGDSEIG